MSRHGQKKGNRLFLYGLGGSICGIVSACVALYEQQAGRHFPGLIFGLGMAFLLQRERVDRIEKWGIHLAAFVGLSTTAYLMAVEIARRLYDLLPGGDDAQRLIVCGFVAGLFGAAKLTAVVQLTRLRAMSPWQWAVCPLTGGVFGILLYPCMRLQEFPAVTVLFVPWQTAVAVALMSFGPPAGRQSVMRTNGH